VSARSRDAGYEAAGGTSRGRHGHLDPVTPARLRRVQRAVGQAQQALRVRGGVREYRRADAGGHRAVHAGQRDVRDRGAQLLGRLHGALGVRVGQQRDELLAADAPDEVARRSARRSASLTAQRTASPRSCPYVSLIDLNWSRSSTSAAIGASVRPDRAIMRLSVS
jgi:hypothetical protein